MIQRVTTLSLSRQVTGELEKAFERMAEAQEKVTTGRRINRLSDDPLGAVRVLDLRSFGASLDQYERNMNVGLPLLEQADAALDSVGRLLIRAKELAIAMANDTNTAKTRQISAVEVRQIFLQLISMANTRVGDNYIFGGFKNGAAPFAEGMGVVNYSGDGGEIDMQVNASTNVAVNLLGNKVFQGAGVADGVGLFDVLLDLETVLNGGSNANTFSLAVNLDSSTTAGTGFTPADAVGTEATRTAWLAEADFSTEVTVFDSLGTAHDLTFLFAKTGATIYKYRVVAKSDEITGGTAGNLFQVAPEGTLSFTGGGAFDAAGSTLQDITLNNLVNGASNITITSGNLKFTGSTQLAQPSSVLTLSQVNTNGFNPQLGRLDAALDQVLSFRAELGGRLNTGEIVKESLELVKIQTIGLRSSIEDADILKVISDFNRLQTALEVALQSASRLIVLSLLDFLR